MDDPTPERLGVVFDGDDTLWSTEWLYDEARADARLIVEEQGLDGRRWESLERLIDVENVDVLGFSAERFPTSCMQAYEQLCREAGYPVDPETLARVKRAAQAVFVRKPQILPAAPVILTSLRASGIRLALLTKGDQAVQELRIAQSGLRDLFDVVCIVPEKTPSIIRSVLAALDVQPSSAWMVGNSVRSDVLPALEAGLRVIWVDAHVWEHERVPEPFAHDRVIAAAELSDVPGIVAA